MQMKVITKKNKRPGQDLNPGPQTCQPVILTTEPGSIIHNELN